MRPIISAWFTAVYPPPARIDAKTREHVARLVDLAIKRGKRSTYPIDRGWNAFAVFKHRKKHFRRWTVFNRSRSRGQLLFPPVRDCFEWFANSWPGSSTRRTVINSAAESDRDWSPSICPGEDYRFVNDAIRRHFPTLADFPPPFSRLCFPLFPIFPVLPSSPQCLDFSGHYFAGKLRFQLFLETQDARASHPCHRSSSSCHMYTEYFPVIIRRIQFDRTRRKRSHAPRRLTIAPPLRRPEFIETGRSGKFLINPGYTALRGAILKRRRWFLSIRPRRGVSFLRGLSRELLQRGRDALCSREIEINALRYIVIDPRERGRGRRWSRYENTADARVPVEVVTN